MADKLQSPQVDFEMSGGPETTVMIYDVEGNRVAEVTSTLFEGGIKTNVTYTTSETYTAANGEELPRGTPGTTIVNDGRPT